MAYKLFLCEVCGKLITQICSLKRHQKRNACLKQQKLIIKKNKNSKKSKKTINLIESELNEFLIFKPSLVLNSIREPAPTLVDLDNFLFRELEDYLCQETPYNLINYVDPSSCDYLPSDENLAEYFDLV